MRFLFIGFILLQVLLLLWQGNGPFSDESIYILAGTRVIEGFAFDSRNLDYFYSRWFQGSPFIWPPLASLGYSLAGLFGSRMIAVVCATVIWTSVFFVCKRQYGPRPAFLAAAAFCIDGQFLALSHSAVYDAPSLALLALACVAASQYASSERRDFAMLSGLLLGAATITKYSTIVGSLGVACILFQGLPFNRAAKAVAIVATVSGSIVSVYCVTTFGSLIPSSFQFYLHYPQRLSRSVILLQFAEWIAVAACFAGYGLGVIAGTQRWKALLSGVAVMIAVVGMHVVTESHVSSHKHFVLGAMFLFPLVGLGLMRFHDRMGNGWLGVAFTLLLVLGGMRSYATDHYWPDSRPAAAYLLENWRKGDSLVSDEAWNFRLPLYVSGAIASPFDLLDSWNVQKGKRNLCDIEWMVGNTSAWREDQISQLARECGHRPVFSSDDVVYRRHESGSFEAVQIKQVVFRRNAT